MTPEKQKNVCIECDEIISEGESEIYWDDIGPCCADCCHIGIGDIDETDHTEDQ